MKAQLASATSLLALLALQGGQGAATYGSLASSAVTAATALTAVTAAMAVSSPAEAGPITFQAGSTITPSVGGGTLVIYDLVDAASVATIANVTATAQNSSGTHSIRASNLSSKSVSGITIQGAAKTGTSVGSGGIATLVNPYTVIATQRTAVSRTQTYTLAGTGNSTATLTIVGSGVAPVRNLSISNNSAATNAGSGTASGGSVGNVLVGRSVSVTMLVSNSGNGNLSGMSTDAGGIISNLRGSFGTPTPSSSVFTGGGTSVTVADTSTQSVVYTFAPTSRGSVTTSATAAFYNGSTDGKNTGTTITTSLVGIGVAPVLSINNTANANYVLVGDTKTVNVTTSNTGDGNTSGLAPSISNLLGSVGSLSGSFTGSGAGISLADKTSATTSYTFNPTARGAATATVTSVFTNGNATNQGSTVSTTLVGTGVAPVLNVTSPTNAGYVLVGNSVSVTAKVTNTGDGNLSGISTNAGGETISNLRGSLSSIASNGFTGSASSVTLGDGASSSYSYVYTPTARGAATASVTSAFVNGSSTNGASTTSIALAGTGVAPVLNVSSSASAGFVLVGKSVSFNTLVTNTGDGNLSGISTNAGGETISNLRGSIASLSSNGFAGSAKSVSLGDGASTTSTYVYTPTARGAATANVTSTFVNGSATNGAGTASVGLIGTGVAPVNAVASASTRVRIGTSGTATVSITNIGDGNKSGLGTVSNLLGTYTNTVGTGFTAAGGGSVSLGDSASQTIGFTYNATSRTTATATAAISFSNGKSDGTNGVQTVSQTVSATGVGPTYASSYAGAANTPAANNITGSNLNFGTVDVGYWQSFYLTLANVTTDNDGGNAALTDLTIESFSFSGANAANFKVALGTGVIHKGSSILVPIQVFSTTNTALVSTLTILTDQSAALGGIGDTFTYQLTAVAAPEPATLAVIGAGLAGLAYARRKRRQPVDA